MTYVPLVEEAKHHKVDHFKELPTTCNKYKYDFTYLYVKKRLRKEILEKNEYLNCTIMWKMLNTELQRFVTAALM